MPMLTFTELQALSGLQRPTAVRAWLRRERVQFMQDGHGNPITTEAAFERRLENKKKQCATEPNFDPDLIFPGKPCTSTRR